MSVTWLFSTFNHLSQKIAGRRAVASSRTRIVLASLISDTSFGTSPTFCHRPGRGFEARLLPSSHRMLPRRRACQAHAPLFEWTKLLRFQTRSLVPLSSTPSSSSPSSSSSVCLFFCGGLGVGEKPTRGELVRSTHRVPSPFISSQRFPFEIFRVSQHSMGLATAYGPFLPAVYHPFVLREAG